MRSRKFDTNDELALLWDFFEDVDFETSEHVRGEHLVKACRLMLLVNVVKLVQKALHIAATNILLNLSRLPKICHRFSKFE